MVQSEQSVVVVGGPRYYSQLDEDHFFGWLQSNPAVVQVSGQGLALHVTIRRPLSKEDLRELIAVFVRYRVDCCSLRQFCDEHPDDYFREEGAYWHSLVYG
jgi:hypothetical protein